MSYEDPVEGQTVTIWSSTCECGAEPCVLHHVLPHQHGRRDYRHLGAYGSHSSTPHTVAHHKKRRLVNTDSSTTAHALAKRTRTNSHGKIPPDSFTLTDRTQRRLREQYQATATVSLFRYASFRCLQHPLRQIQLLCLGVPPSLQLENLLSLMQLSASAPPPWTLRIQRPSCSPKHTTSRLHLTCETSPRRQVLLP